MTGTKETALADHVNADAIAAAPVQPLRIIMPSSRHSVLAKAARYRSEPERVNVLVAEPLVAVVHGLHADHTVRQTGQELVCSCDRFRRGEGQCAHVLAVEHHRWTAAAISEP
jgi:hypothetical protein